MRKRHRVRPARDSQSLGWPGVGAGACKRPVAQPRAGRAVGDAAGEVGGAFVPYLRTGEATRARLSL